MHEYWWYKIYWNTWWACFMKKIVVATIVSHSVRCHFTMMFHPSRVSTVLQAVINGRSFPRSEDWGYRKYRLSGELFSSGCGTLRALWEGEGLSYRQLRSLTLACKRFVSPFGREMPPAAALWRSSGAMGGGGAVLPPAAFLMLNA